MAVHRISPRAEMLLQKMAKDQGVKPSDFISSLIVDYHAGLSFDPDPADIRIGQENRK